MALIFGKIFCVVATGTLGVKSLGYPLGRRIGQTGFTLCGINASSSTGCALD